GHSFSGGGLGGRSFSPGFTARSPGFTARGVPGGNAFVNRGATAQPFVNRGVTGQPFVNRGVSAAPLAGRRVTAHGPFALFRHHGGHICGLIPGFGVGYYWYYGDCWAWTEDYGWVNLCADGVY